ncbi:MAG: hypothetical protein MMC33_001192 [Icmadophila ericetorum]|nr:hypothetical protein [Icmadophila ericetorum]
MELNLLLETTDLDNNTFITIEGKNWTLSKRHDLGKPNTVPNFACVSYSWGKEEQVANPFHPTHRISPNTIPALTAAIRTDKSNAFWIDALCIPFDQPERRLTLESMGYIYHSAVAVISVLSDTSFAAIERASNAEYLTYEMMLELEQDKWVSSVWTYQEVINNSNVCLTTVKEATNKFVNAEDFLNFVGQSLDKWKRQNGISTLQLRNMFPRLDALEDLIADWLSKATGYGLMNSFMLQSNMDRRTTDSEENRWYSMMGVLTQEPSRWLADVKSENLPVTYMALCESLNDFSYIYSSADRDTNPKRRWSPRSGPLPSIFAFHSFGEPQSGQIVPEGLLLDRMLSFEPSHLLNDAARNLIVRWLDKPEFVKDPEIVLGIKLLAAFKDVGFRGVGGPIITGNGIFLPQQSLVRAGEEIRILVSGTIRWVFGAPALAMLAKEGETSYVPGIFAGVIDVAGATPVLLK